MADTTIAIQKFLGITEQPLYQQPPGTCKGLTNLRVTADGLLEARGGLEKLLPSGGTATAPISSGFYTGAHEHNSPVAWVMSFNGTATYTNNLSLQAYFPYFNNTAVGSRVYFIAPDKYSRIDLLVGVAGTGGYTILWKYIDNAGVAQTLAGPTEDFKTLGARTVSFSPPATWGLNAVNNVLGYVVYAEVATAVVTIQPRQKDQRIFVDWQGMKQLYLAASDGASGTANGQVLRYGQSGTTANWTQITSSGFSGSDPRVRFASWRGYLYWMNGVDQKRYNMDTVADIGFASPTGAIAAPTTSGTGLTGTFQYYATYGYGAAGELGESGYLTGGTKAAANQGLVVDLTGLTSVPAAGTVDIIYLYRSVDLSTVPAGGSFGTFPAYRVATITRQADGTFPANFTDSVMAVPLPVKALVVTSVLPPSNCRFLAVHRSRLFMGSNRSFPGRVWWSKNFEPESFNQDEDFADFTRQTGGVITGMVEFADQIVVFTEDAMYGIANVDQDPPNIYIIAAGIGCVAPESVRAAYGLLCWLARGGLYIWDGQSPPKRVSDQQRASLTNLSREGHFQSWGAIYRQQYEVTLITQANAVTGSRWRYDFVSGQFSQVVLATSDLNLAAILTITAPTGHEDAGGRHPLYGKVQATGTLFHVYVGDWKITDDGNVIQLAAAVHVGPAGGRVIVPRSVMVVYTAMTAPITIAFSNASYIGDTPTIGSVFTDGASDYTFAVAQVTSIPAYTGDLVITVSGNPSGTTAGRQNIIALFLDGNLMEHPMRTN